VTFHNAFHSDYVGGTVVHVQKYPVGKKVTVYYDRNNPSYSVLEPDVRNTSGAYVFVAGALFLVLAVIVSIALSAVAV
jgi:hypothetical protein